jgi:hypothetical protein
MILLVDRPTVCTNPIVVATTFDAALIAIVAFNTKRHQGAHVEFVFVAVVRLDVISNACRNDQAAIGAQLA